MILTLYLISANVYNSVDAPSNRGFSYIEVWMLGTQFPILLALFEYGLVLYWKKIAKPLDDQNQRMNFDDSKQNIDERIKWIDFVTMTISLIFIISFTSIYWILLWWIVINRMQERIWDKYLKNLNCEKL